MPEIPMNTPAASAEPESAAQLPTNGQGPAVDRQEQHDDELRTLEVHHTVGPHGEDEVEATDDLGRRWYHVRPEPRRRADVMGFNYTWWAICLLIFVVAFIPWGWWY